MTNSILIPKKVLLFGATGLVGRSILKNLLTLKSGLKIHALTRRDLPADLKTDQVTVYKMNFDSLDENSECFKVDTVMCAIGTTIKVAGSQQKFREVDYTYPLRIAQIARRNGAETFLLVSALGANAHSSIFYNKVKGELETALQNLGFKSLIMIRPSVLVGDRETVRPLEKISQTLGVLLPKKWKSVPAENVAKKMISFLSNPPNGVLIVENKDLF